MCTRMIKNREEKKTLPSKNITLIFFGRKKLCKPKDPSWNLVEAVHLLIVPACEASKCRSRVAWLGNGLPDRPRELTYPTWGRGNSSKKKETDILFPTSRRVRYLSEKNWPYNTNFHVFWHLAAQSIQNSASLTRSDCFQRHANVVWRGSDISSSVGSLDTWLDKMWNYVI